MLEHSHLRRKERKLELVEGIPSPMENIPEELPQILKKSGEHFSALTTHEQICLSQYLLLLFFKVQEQQTGAHP